MLIQVKRFLILIIIIGSYLDCDDDFLFFFLATLREYKYHILLGCCLGTMNNSD